MEIRSLNSWNETRNGSSFLSLNYRSLRHLRGILPRSLTNVQQSAWRGPVSHSPSTIARSLALSLADSLAPAQIDTRNEIDRGGDRSHINHLSQFRGRKESVAEQIVPLGVSPGCATSQRRAARPLRQLRDPWYRRGEEYTARAYNWSCWLNGSIWCKSLVCDIHWYIPSAAPPISTVMPSERASERAPRARRRPSPNVVSVAAQYLEISEWVNYGPMERRCCGRGRRWIAIARTRRVAGHAGWLWESSWRVPIVHRGYVRLARSHRDATFSFPSLRKDGSRCCLVVRSPSRIREVFISHGDTWRARARRDFSHFIVSPRCFTSVTSVE